MRFKIGNLSLAAAFMAALVWPLAGPTTAPGAAAPLADDGAEACMQARMAGGMSLDDAAGACAVPAQVQAQIDAIEGRNAGKLVADGGPAQLHACLTGKLSYAGSSPTLASDAEASCMAFMEKTFWTKDPTPEQIDAIVGRNAGKLVDGGAAKLRDCLQGRVSDRVLPPDSEAVCMGVMEANFWFKDPTPEQIEAIVGRNTGQLVDGGAQKLRECLQGKVTDRVLAPDAEAVCMGAMEANFWIKRPKKPCDTGGAIDIPVLAGMVSALWANDCGDDDDDDDDDDDQNDNKPQQHKDKNKQKKEEPKKDDPKPAHPGCTC